LGWAESVPRKKAAPQNVLLFQILLASVFDQMFRMEFLSIQFSLRGGTVDKQATHVRHGANTSLDDIAKEPGVGAGTLYRHFQRESLPTDCAVEPKI
jgi:hypothetical protein